MTERIYKDDRNAWERNNLTTAIGGRDGFLSGKLCEGASFALWACADEDADTVREWVDSRGDIKHPRTYETGIGADFECGGDHVHVYVVRPGHPALGGQPSASNAYSVAYNRDFAMDGGA